MSNETATPGEVRTAEDPTKAVLSKSKLHEKHLCDYVINVATGCRHGCRFCYVPGTPNISARGEMLEEEIDVDDGQEEWGEYVLYRDNIPEELPGILDRKRTWKETDEGQGIIGVSFGTDCFMDARAAEITASVIETCAEHERHVRILTRNPMLASKYLDTFEAAGEYVTIGSSIPTLDEAVVQALEPNAPPVAARIKGLQRFADAGVPVYVSMSPTYPSMSRYEIESLLAVLGSLDPDVVFHEPINPRGKNFEMTVAAAEAAGLDDLAKSLVDVQGPDAWLRYACEHFRWVQNAADAMGVPIHLWPDDQLVSKASGQERGWLWSWKQNRQSVEDFAGRPDPEREPPSPPERFSWEQPTEDLEAWT